MTTIVNVKVAHIRPTYHTLEDWMTNPQHEYIGRSGIVFINNERFPKKSSEWANPFTVKKYGIDKCLELYEIWLRTKIKKEGIDEFNKLTIHKDVSLDYLENLADMWCAPQWIIDEIKERKLNAIDVNNVNNNDINNHVFKCINCSVGYKIKENTKTSCKHHNRLFNNSTNSYDCCGRGYNEPCIIGYHYINAFNYNVIYDKLNASK